MTVPDIVFRQVATGRELGLVGSVMSPLAGVIAAHEPIEKALALMDELRLDVLPVSHGEQLVGIVTAAESRTHRIRNLECEIVVATIDVEQEPRDVLTQVETLGARVAQEATATTLAA